ncbi:MAG: hypothetical protein RMJ84_03630 [Sandaracinaceae bacterium]|nr:hypothetical protein [Sandaracinaceae bacterium]
MAEIEKIERKQGREKNNAQGIQPSWMDLTLALYLERIIRGARVVVWGKIEGPALAWLEGVSARCECLGHDEWPSGSGELAWVADAEAFIGEQSRLERLAHFLGQRGFGVLIFAHGHRYEEIYRNLRAHFGHVRMFGQAAFLGHVIVDFARAQEADELVVDGTLRSGPLSPARHVAVVGSRPVLFEPYVILDLPEDAYHALQSTRRELEASRARLNHAEERLEEAQREIARNVQRIDELRHELERLRGELNSGRASWAAREQALIEERLLLERMLEDKKLELAELTQEVAQAKALAEAQKREVEELEAECQRFEAQLQASAKEILALRHEVERRGEIVRDLLEGGAQRIAAASLPSEGAFRDKELEEALARLQKKAVDAEAERIVAEFARDEAQREAARLARELEAEAALRARCEEGLRAFTAEREALEEALNHTKSQLEAMREHARNLEEKLRALENTQKEQAGLVAVGWERAQAFEQKLAEIALQKELESERWVEARHEMEGEIRGLRLRLSDFEKALAQARSETVSLGPKGALEEAQATSVSREVAHQSDEGLVSRLQSRLSREIGAKERLTQVLQSQASFIARTIAKIENTLSTLLAHPNAGLGEESWAIAEQNSEGARAEVQKEIEEILRTMRSCFQELQGALGGVRDGGFECEQ